METSTKNKQSDNIINDMVHNAFCDVKMIEAVELTEGFFNVAYRVKLSDGRYTILKIAPSKDTIIMTHEKNIMKTEVEVMKLIEKNTNIPVPKVLYYDNSNELCDSDYFFMSKLPGESLSSIGEKLNDTEKNNINYKVGEYNQVINSFKGKKFGYYGQPDKQGVEWFEVFYSMINDAIYDAKVLNIDIGVEPETIRRLLVKDKEIFKEVKEPKLVHWDLWAGNVFVKDGNITGLIDFERYLWADVLMEVGFRSYGYDEDFYKGYGVDVLTDNQKKRVRWYDLYLFLISVLECDYRQYADRGAYNWARQMIEETTGILKNR
ncbi:aminoglycoside phosphotransferase family protein [Clostridium sp. C8-1-8]|uniref:aminoglycoside phosphotransferase family protein n=1 Tax=Clostridium sp. C8-1-8 TaxID=2698831 RepID=UPI00136EA579|nr:aminoglycoside phosphotransferase family protein [Clostridium sp. C8-1-8]